MKKLFFLILVLIALAGCQKHEESAPPVQTTETTAPAPEKVLLGEPIEAKEVELPSEAIPYWRNAAGGSRPALVLFAIHPFLQPLNEAQRDAVMKLVATGTPDDFAKRGTFFRVDPALISTQALSAALAGNLFSEIIWVFPSTTPLEEFSQETFRNQMVEAGFMTPEESAGMTYQDGIFSGTLRGTSFKAVHPLALSAVSGPAILHIDLGYFKGQYKSEIKTPLYPLLLETAKTLRGLNLKVRGVTLSYSTEEGEFSLETRFLINRLAELLAAPSMLDKPLPENWNLHSEALYTINFFMEDKVTELYTKAVHLAPGDPAVLYGLALRRLRDKDLKGALELIERAAKEDEGYALEYFNLADRAANAGDFANASMLLDRGRSHSPHNPFIDFQRAGVLIQQGQTDAARQILLGLKKLPWSPDVHAGTLQRIDDMLAAVSNIEDTADNKTEARR